MTHRSVVDDALSWISGSLLHNPIEPNLSTDVEKDVLLLTHYIVTQYWSNTPIHQGFDPGCPCFSMDEFFRKLEGSASDSMSLPTISADVRI